MVDQKHNLQQIVGSKYILETMYLSNCRNDGCFRGKKRLKFHHEAGSFFEFLIRRIDFHEGWKGKGQTFKVWVCPSRPSKDISMPVNVSYDDTDSLGGAATVNRGDGQEMGSTAETKDSIGVESRSHHNGAGKKGKHGNTSNKNWEEARSSSPLPAWKEYCELVRVLAPLSTVQLGSDIGEQIVNTALSRSSNSSPEVLAAFTAVYFWAKLMSGSIFFLRPLALVASLMIACILSFAFTPAGVFLTGIPNYVIVRNAFAAISMLPATDGAVRFCQGLLLRRRLSQWTAAASAMDILGQVVGAAIVLNVNIPSGNFRLVAAISPIYVGRAFNITTLAVGLWRNPRFLIRPAHDKGDDDDDDDDAVDCEDHDCSDNAVEEERSSEKKDLFLINPTTEDRRNRMIQNVILLNMQQGLHLGAPPSTTRDEVHHPDGLEGREEDKESKEHERLLHIRGGQRDNCSIELQNLKGRRNDDHDGEWRNNDIVNESKKNDDGGGGVGWDDDEDGNYDDEGGNDEEVAAAPLSSSASSSSPEQRREGGVQGAPLTIASVIKFAWPLVLTDFVQKASRPLANLVTARHAAVAVLGLIYPIGHMPYGWINAMKSMHPAYLDRPHMRENRIPRFTIMVILFSVTWGITATLSGLTLAILEKISKVDPQLAQSSFAPLMALRCVSGSTLVPNNMASFADGLVRIPGIIVVLISLNAAGVKGATLGVAGLFSGFACQAVGVVVGMMFCTKNRSLRTRFCL
eukprot:jgi/Bigna1/139392/aug1.50_g14100